jgi:quinol monooxygenase YgiN
MVRVLIDRTFASGHEDALRDALVELRREASRAQGYISGETLVDHTNPLHFLVISTWTNLHAWEAWHGSEERAQKVTPILLYLREPERIQAFEHI